MEEKMKIAFWGLGSIAMRHIKNLVGILDGKGVKYEIDVFRHSDNTIKDETLKALVQGVYLESELESNNKIYDVIFITNPTSLHHSTIKRCVPFTKHMFIEKPVFGDCDEKVEELGLKPDSVYYVACPLRYTTVLQYIKDHIDFNRVYSARVICSSYLPEWRPNTDYRESYSAKKELGGGVAIDLIHEWDYLVSFFGFPKETFYAGGTYSHLEIDSDDLATYIGVYEDKIIELHLDYFGRKTIRECAFFMKDETVIADLVSGEIKYLKEEKVVDLKEERDDYQIHELEHFLDIVDGKIENDSTVADALDVLKIATNYRR